MDQIKVLDRQLTSVAKVDPVARLFMTAPGVGVITPFPLRQPLTRRNAAGALPALVLISA